jgi:hypothetical protein
MTVLILGDPQEDHVRHVRLELGRRGVDARCLDARDFPSRLRISFDPERGRGHIAFCEQGSLDLEDVSAVYWRSYNLVAPPPLPHAEQAHIASNDARSLFESLLIWLPARWVNGFAAWQLHQTKPVQFARVAALGVAVPETMLTNDPAAATAFAQRVGRVVFKPVQGGAHTERLTDAHLAADALQRLSFAPVTLQAEVPGTNIRAFVAGDRVFGCEVRTEAIDFRDDPCPQLCVHHLPAESEKVCRRIARALELRWTGIDFRRTPEGEYVFLEANPSPMFLGFEQATGLPLTESLLDLLVGRGDR